MKICIISGSRSEFDLLRNLIVEIKKDRFFNSKLLITGSHLSKFFGNTIEYIKKQKIKINYKVNISIKGDSTKQISNSFSVGLKKFTKIFSKLKPDAIIVLGDRYEIFSTVISATFKKIPIIHIHGGEVTSGSMDEGIRHSITKLSHVHFVSSENYKKRVLQLGESKKNVFNVGSLGVESIKKNKFLSRNKLQSFLRIKFLKKIVLVSLHPETLEKKLNKENLKNFFNALKTLDKHTIIFTMPNADIGYKFILNKIKEFTKNRKNAFLFKSLGHQKYFSLCKFIDFHIGNSSSGIIELASFRKPSINVGMRQSGRMKPKNVIDCDYKKENILKKIQVATSTKFKKKIIYLKNPYYKRDTSKKILKNLKKINFNKILYKKFVDII